MKIVLDTNVLVSGLLNANGNPAKIVNLALSGALQICFDSAILSEYVEVLGRPRFKFDPTRISEILLKLTTEGIRVDASSFFQLNLPDPDDEPFLAVALASSSDFLVTGNLAHFPDDKRHGSKVVSPADFVEHWISSA